MGLLQYAYVYFRRQQGSPLLFPINNHHLVHYYADIGLQQLLTILRNGKSMYYRQFAYWSKYYFVFITFRAQIFLNLFSRLTAPKIENFAELIFAISPLVVNFAEYIFTVQLGFLENLWDLISQFRGQTAKITARKNLRP